MLSRPGRTLDAVEITYREWEPSRLEQLAYKSDLFPDELRERLRAEIKRRVQQNRSPHDIRNSGHGSPAL